MKKIIALTLSLVLLCALFIGCGGGSGSEPEPETNTNTDISQAEKMGAALPGALPSETDELTQAVKMSDPNGITVLYPETMAAIDEQPLCITFTSQSGEGDLYGNVVMRMQETNGYDQLMTGGAAASKAGMLRFATDSLNTAFPGKITSTIGTEFYDGGAYYGAKVYVWMTGSAIAADVATPMRGAFDVRYYGPGYAVVCGAVADESIISRYYGIAKNMINGITYGGNWTTTAPTAPQSEGVQGGSDSGDYGTAYYWYDNDGALWYWNGYEDIYISDPEYYDEYYEPNDAGWDDEYDYYYEDGEYYEPNDAGWQ